MADHLNVDPAALYQASGDIQRQGETLIGIQQTSYGESENAQSGWVGNSSGALGGLLEHWIVVEAHHTAKFSHHANGLQHNATCFTEMADNHAKALEAVYPPSAREL